jgi:hypothetical protein
VWYNYHAMPIERNNSIENFNLRSLSELNFKVGQFDSSQFKSNPDFLHYQDQIKSFEVGSLIKSTIDEHINLLPISIQNSFIDSVNVDSNGVEYEESGNDESGDSFTVSKVGFYFPKREKLGEPGFDSGTGEQSVRTILADLTIRNDEEGDIRFRFDESDHGINSFMINEIIKGENKHGHILYSSKYNIGNTVVIHMTSYDAGELVDGELNNLSATYSLVVNLNVNKSLHSVALCRVENSDYAKFEEKILSKNPAYVQYKLKTGRKSIYKPNLENELTRLIPMSYDYTALADTLNETKINKSVWSKDFRVLNPPSRGMLKVVHKRYG